MVSLFTLNCLESLNVERCFGSCSGGDKKRKKKSDKRKKNDDSDSSSDEDFDEKNISRPSARRRFSALPMSPPEAPLTDQISICPFIAFSPAPRPPAPSYYGMQTLPNKRQDSNTQLVSIRRKRYRARPEEQASSSDSTPAPSVKKNRFSTKQKVWDPNTWVAKAPGQPVSFEIGSEHNQSVCVVNMSKLVAQVSGEGFCGMLRSPSTEAFGYSIAQTFTARFAELLNILFDTTAKNLVPSIISIVCDNIPRNIVCYPILAKDKFEGVLYLWRDALTPQNLDQMISVCA